MGNHACSCFMQPQECLPVGHYGFDGVCFQQWSATALGHLSNISKHCHVPTPRVTCPRHQNKCSYITCPQAALNSQSFMSVTWATRWCNKVSKSLQLCLLLLMQIKSTPYSTHPPECFPSTALGDCKHQEKLEPEGQCIVAFASCNSLQKDLLDFAS